MLDASLTQVDFLTAGDFELPLDKVVAGDHFGNGVLNLDSRVGLDEVVLLVPVQEKFDCGGIYVLGLFYNPKRGLANLLPGPLVEYGAG